MNCKSTKEIFSGDNDLIEMRDSKGNVTYYIEETNFQIDDRKFAVLAKADDDCCECCDAEEVLIAKIIPNESGRELYIDPTDEEFEKARAIYEKFLEKEDDL